MQKVLSVIKTSGYSIVEILLAISIYAITVTTLIGTLVYGQQSATLAGTRSRATYLAEEGLEATRNIRDDSFINLLDGTYGLAIENDQWVFSGTSDTSDIFTRTITILSVDSSTKRIVSTVTWKQTEQRDGTIALTSYLTSWTTSIWEDTTKDDFNAGTDNNTIVTDNNGGEVQLGTIIYADWCNPSITLNAYNLPGQGIAESLTAIPGEVFIGTGANASGLSFADLTVTSDDPPVVNTVGTFNGDKTNDVFGENLYGYIATDTNSSEVVIISLSTFLQEGYFNAPGSGDGTAVATSGNYGFMTEGNNFYAFDLSSKIGSRAQVGSAVSLAGTGVSISISGNYAYVAISNATTQMQVIDITTPSSMSVVANAQVNGGIGIDVFARADGNRAYLVTDSDASKPEFHIINSTTKSGTMPVVTTADTSGMAPRGVTAITDQRAIVVGTGGTQQYQVFNIENESSISKCGGLATTTAINEIASVNDFDGNAYSYIVTQDTSSELKVIRGGPGGGFGGGLGYPLTGDFISRVFDTGMTAGFLGISWTNQVPANTDLKLQVRTGNSADLSAVAWAGPDGTASTYFTDETGELMPTIVQNKRYIQYKAFYTSDSVSTPILEATRVNYEN